MCLDDRRVQWVQQKAMQQQGVPKEKIRCASIALCQFQWFALTVGGKKFI